MASQAIGASSAAGGASVVLGTAFTVPVDKRLTVRQVDFGNEAAAIARLILEADLDGSGTFATELRRYILSAAGFFGREYEDVSGGPKIHGSAGVGGNSVLVRLRLEQPAAIGPATGFADFDVK